MKKGIHPKWYPEAKVICNGEVVMTVGATQPELRVDIWSGNHPFFTGERRIVDTAGQVDRFMKRLKQYDQHQTDVDQREVVALEKQKTRFLKQQVVALDLGDEVTQVLHDATIISVGDLIETLEQNKESLLTLQGFTPEVVATLETKVSEAKTAYFQE
ncbi:50S ribosomal protein L31 [Anaerolineales bacterium HSG6]|nr:50S ribosomal protein L31 [Anaerolineales bacterium HSG6]MDM8530974.1 50S ribosomal protein L31 [Anaerolineales bacterium HSG25]